jgi:DNA-binding winged helix-turn-helix (wHTH) protein
LLFLLAEKRGALVTREEILERIWGKDVFLETDHSINTAIRKIRHALRDDAEAPRFVVTVASKGYRFVAPLREPHRVKSQREAENTVRPRRSMVGREPELAELRAGLADAAGGADACSWLQVNPASARLVCLPSLPFWLKRKGWRCG